MFLPRLLSILVLLPLVVLFLLKAPPAVFYYLSIILMLGVAWEWSQFVTKIGSRRIFYVCMCLAAILVFQFVVFYLLLILGFIYWCWCAWVVYRYNRHMVPHLIGLTAVRGVSGLFAIALCWRCMIYLQLLSHGKALLYVLIIIWLADTGAYIGGRLWGSTPLLANVSPKKTVEGLLVGLGIVLVFVLIESYFHIFFARSGIGFVIVSFVTAVFSVIGDLMISVLKRVVKVKDTGKLIPGHGGALDRLDSMLAALPVFCFLFVLFVGI